MKPKRIIISLTSVLLLLAFSTTRDKERLCDTALQCGSSKLFQDLVFTWSLLESSPSAIRGGFSFYASFSATRFATFSLELFSTSAYIFAVTPISQCPR